MTLNKTRILFLDDHEDTREMVALILKQSGYEVLTSATISATLKLARRGNFNLFIFDSTLPDGSGLDLCADVRRFDLQTPILFYSGLAEDKYKNLALSSGAQAYLVKPVDVPELLQTVQKLIAQAKPTPQLTNNAITRKRSAAAAG